MLYKGSVWTPHFFEAFLTIPDLKADLSVKISQIVKLVVSTPFNSESILSTPDKYSFSSLSEFHETKVSAF